MRTKKPLTFQLDAHESGRRELFITDPEKRPSWKRYGDGHANLRVYLHTAARWVGLSLAEYAKGDPVTGKGSSSKETYMELDEATGRALYALLGEIYGADVAPLADAETV